MSDIPLFVKDNEDILLLLGIHYLSQMKNRKKDYYKVKVILPYWGLKKLYQLMKEKVMTIFALSPIQLRNNSGTSPIQLRYISVTTPAQLRYNSGRVWRSMVLHYFRYNSCTTRYNSGTTPVKSEEAWCLSERLHWNAFSAYDGHRHTRVISAAVPSS